MKSVGLLEVDAMEELSNKIGEIAKARKTASCVTMKFLHAPRLTVNFAGENSIVHTTTFKFWIVLPVELLIFDAGTERRLWQAGSQTLELPNRA
jgi:hypothetical protein